MEKNDDMKMAKMAWEQRYSDDSGVEFAVRFDGEKSAGLSGEAGVIEFEAVDTVCFPASKIDWLIMCLERIRDEQGSCLSAEIS